MHMAVVHRELQPLGIHVTQEVTAGGCSHISNQSTHPASFVDVWNSSHPIFQQHCYGNFGKRRAALSCRVRQGATVAQASLRSLGRPKPACPDIEPVQKT